MRIHSGFVLPLCLIPLLAAAPARAHALFPNEPDPFCPDVEVTEIGFSLHEATQARLEVRDALGQTARLLVDGMLAAGMYLVVWDGLDEQGDTLRTGEFEIRLDAGLENFADPATTFCGDDLFGPYRIPGAGGDVAVAFAVGLTLPQNFELLILADGEPVRILPAGLAAPGVVTVFWDLRDELDEPVPGGFYTCRLDVPGYFEEIVFLVEPIEPLHPVVSFGDRYGVPRSGSSDPETPTGLETPLQDGRIDFGRPLSAAEYGYVIDNLSIDGALQHISPVGDGVVAADTSWVEFPLFEAERRWADILGEGELRFPMGWADPPSHYFRLRHLLAGIAGTNEMCDPVGPVDPTDWICYEEGAPEDPPSLAVSFGPACPNPVGMPGATTLRFGLPQSGHVLLEVHGEDGRRERTLVDATLPGGLHSVLWDLLDDGGAQVATGFHRAIFTYEAAGTVHVGGGDIYVGDPTPAPPALADRVWLTCHPNPVAPGGLTHIALAVDRARPGRLAIHDVAGRRVRLLAEFDAREAGPRTWTWDGRDDSGRALAAGVYFIRFAAPNFTETKKVSLLR